MENINICPRTSRTVFHKLVWCRPYTRIVGGASLKYMNASEVKKRSVCSIQVNHLTDPSGVFDPCGILATQAHMWDTATPIEETLRTFDDLIKGGKIRHYGFSNVCGWQMQKISDTAKLLNLNPCVSLQQHYNLLTRDSELESLIACQNEGIYVLPWGPLRGGMLTGKFKKDQEPDATGSRVGYFNSKKEIPHWMKDWIEFGSNDKYWALITVIETIAKAHGKTVPKVALRWLLQKEVVSSVVVSCTFVQQLEDNIGASGGWEISADEMKELEAAAPLSISYPYDLLRGLTMSGRINKYI